MCPKAGRMSYFCENIAMLPRGTICSESCLPEVVVKVGHLTVEAFVFTGSSVARIAESVKSSSYRRAFKATVNCSA